MTKYLPNFTNYDFVGYILPRALFCLGIIVLLPCDSLCLVTSFKAFVVENSIEVNAFVFSILTLCLVVAFDFIGHLIGCVAHLVFDRKIVYNLLGFPFYRLLEPSGKLKLPSRNKTFILSLFFFLVLRFSVVCHPLRLDEFDILHVLCKYGLLFLFGCICVKKNKKEMPD